MMPTSVSTATRTDSAQDQRRQAREPGHYPGASIGFTLVEVLVVVVILAIVATVATTMMRRFAQQRVQVAELLRTLSEQSIFLGDLLGARLEENRITPLRFDLDSRTFVTFSANMADAPRAVTLPEHLRLHWTFNEDLDAASTPVPSIPDAFLKADDQDEDQSGAQARPQLLFFPSGEATDVRIVIESRDASASLRALVSMDAMGRVELPEDTP